MVDADVLGRRRSGDETYVRSLLRWLPVVAPDLRVAAATRHPELVGSGVDPVSVGRAGPILRLAVGLGWTLRRLGAQLYHGNYFLPAGWRGPSIVTVHDVSFERHRFMPRSDRAVFRALVPRALARADRVLTVTEWSRDDIAETYGVDRERIIVTPNAVEEDCSPDGSRPDRAPYVLLVGGTQLRKDPVTAVRALARSGLDLDLVITGRAGEADAAVSDAMRRERLDGRVHVLGYVDRPSLCALYRGAEALLFPSRYEGFGIPVLEAMASGTPVVAAAATSVPEVAGDAAVLVEAGDAEAMGVALGAVVEEPGPWVDRGLRRAAQFSWPRTAEIVATTYRELLAR